MGTRNQTAVFHPPGARRGIKAMRLRIRGGRRSFWGFWT